IIFIDPAESIKEPPKGNRLPKKILTRKETLKVLDQPNLGTRLGIRDRAILEIFDSTGIRKAELCRLTIYDADLTGKMLRIKGKGQKDRVVPLGKHAVRFLREYISKVRPHYTKKNRSERHLFIDKFGRPIKKQAVSVMVKKYGQEAGLDRPISPHIFRHGFATGLVQNGADIVAVQKMMGHTDLRTTQTYVKTLGFDLKKVHQKTHPREQDRVSKTAGTIKRKISNEGHIKHI
ncbi:MAG: tyrosine-type recombinase/integrase, partial [Desulfobacteraceae bacterium]|nr:tyrosine-type recombinase/integrase [Desulfobacteraceae bacterium]